MPTLPKQLAAPIYQAGAMIYGKLLPIPETELPKVETAFETFIAACENALNGTDRVPTGAELGTNQRGRGAPPMNNDIIAFLSTEPQTLRTPRQIWVGIKSTYPLLTSDKLQARLKNNAGKPGMWIVGPGGKYGMPGAGAKTSTTKANASTTKANVNVVPAPAASPDEKAQPRVYAYIEAHPGYTKAQVIAAFKTSADPVRENIVGVALSRLRRGKQITDAEEGPYWTLRVAKPPAHDGVGAAAQPTA